MSSIESKIQELGYTLPEAPAPAGSYVNCVRSGNLLFLAGGIPPLDDDTFLGKVPTDTSVETAQQAARLITLNRLAVVKAEIGDLDHIERIVNVGGLSTQSLISINTPRLSMAVPTFLLKYSAIRESIPARQWVPQLYRSMYP